MSRSGKPLLLESIAILDGVPQRIELHQGRVDRSRRELLHLQSSLDLLTLIDVPEDHRIGLVKCRILYDVEAHSVGFSHYQPREHKGIAIVQTDIDYSYKFADREIFSDLEAKAQDRAIIIVRDGFVTDSTYANLVFFNGELWVTPDTPLLNGVMRQWLLGQGAIVERRIAINDLGSYQSVKLINALRSLVLPPIPLNDIIHL